MTVSADLPAPVDRYFAANADLDLERMLAPFAPDAVVSDERETHQGTGQIRAWIEKATLANRAVATPLDAKANPAGAQVRASVAGAFPGSPIELTFTFRLQRDEIARLDIA